MNYSTFLKRTFIICCLIKGVTPISAQIPAIEWQQCFGGSLIESAEHLVRCNDGGYAIVGSTNSTDGDITALNGNYDFWVVKTDSLGNMEWQQTYGGSDRENSYTIIQTLDGGFVVAGRTCSGDLDVSGHHGYPFGYSTCYDGWIIKIDALGTLVWQRALGGSVIDEISGVVELDDSSLVICGRTGSFDGDVTGHLGSQTANPANPAFDFWIIKTDALGNTIWDKCFGGTGELDQPTQIRKTFDSGFVVCGSTNSLDIDVTGYHNSPSGHTDYWVLKIDSSGTVQWQKTLGGFDVDYANDIIQTSDSGYVVTGRTSSVDGDVTAAFGGYDCWTVKLDKNGSMQWQISVGGSSLDNGLSVVETDDGGFLVGGRTASNDGLVSGNNGSNDAWLIKLSATGLFLWQQCYGGSFVEDCNGIVRLSDTEYVITGGSGAVSGQVTCSHGNSDFWLVKLVEDSTTSVNSFAENIPVTSLYPNPASNLVTLTVPGNRNKTEVAVYNIAGKLCFSRTFVDEESVQFDVRGFVNGIYFVKVWGNEYFETKKMIINRSDKQR